MSNAQPPRDTSGPTPQYVVVARRYRPQLFDELIGQEHVAQALTGAISTNRVGHAYLFTGARGVGKTSAARILAKALNCESGPSPVPCNRCDICESVSSGDDMDVLEIDGASNRGIDEIRQLRQNAGVRPSRARFKIYIIDEVHMLTREAFNALLKTLEEPPEHVKFIFCTTEPTKIPITILSRCQRFDFAGIVTGSITRRLQQIVEAEGVEAEPEALEVLARRAAGSMRDSQSLLEQLLAFAPSTQGQGRITMADVHGMLGTAGDQRLSELVSHLVDRDAAAALADLDTALAEGVDVAQLLEQLLGYFRDCMAAAVDCPADAYQYTSPGTHEAVAEAGKRLGLTTVLAVMQILDQTLSRLRFSTQGCILTELALVRICALENLDELAGMIAALRSGSPSDRVSEARPAATPGQPTRAQNVTARPQAAPAPVSDQAVTPRSASSVVELTPDNATEVWTSALSKMSGFAVDHAREFHRITISAPGRLVISFKRSYASAKSICERPEKVAQFEKALAEVTGQTIRLSFTVEEDESEGAESRAPAARPVTPHQRLREVAKHPMIRRAGELFGAQPIEVTDPPNRE